jgi:hypothetical protein
MRGAEQQTCTREILTMSPSIVRYSLLALANFRPNEWHGRESEAAKREEEREELIRLTARFVESLGKAPLARLRSRATWLDQQTAPSSPLEAAWQTVLALVRADRRLTSRRSPQQASAFLKCPATDYIFYPLLMGHALGTANSWLHDHPKEPRHSAYRDWRDSLWAVAVGAERESAWGSYLVMLCHVAQDPRSPQYELHRFLVECFKNLHWFAAPIQKAAKDLIRDRAHASNVQMNHSPDFRSILWFGTSYSFTSGQAACVKQLWQAWQSGAPEIGQGVVLDNAGMESSRLVDIFKGHLAWGTVIVPGGTKGAYRLQPPL